MLRWAGNVAAQLVVHIPREVNVDFKGVNTITNIVLSAGHDPGPVVEGHVSNILKSPWAIDWRVSSWSLRVCSIVAVDHKRVTASKTENLQDCTWRESHVCTYTPEFISIPIFSIYLLRCPPHLHNCFLWMSPQKPIRRRRIFLINQQWSTDIQTINVFIVLNMVFSRHNPSILLLLVRVSIVVGLVAPRTHHGPTAWEFADEVDDVSL